MTDPEPGEPRRDVGAEDAAWRDIVEHYGDRPALPDEPPTGEPPTVRPAVPVAPAAARTAPVEPVEHYVPPPPPPAALPRGPRALAWLGLFGSPVVVLVCLVARVSVPQWAAFLLFVAFVGGFGFLVATMRRHDDSDPWDDGAVV